MRTHRFLSEIDSTYSIDIVPSELVEKCVTSLSLLTKYFLVASNLNRNSKDDLDVLRFWREFWYQPPSVIELFNQVIENQQSLDMSKSTYLVCIRSHLMLLLHSLMSKMKRTEFLVYHITA
jgi:hypothetical protein